MQAYILLLALLLCACFGCRGGALASPVLSRWRSFVPSKFFSALLHDETHRQVARYVLVARWLVKQTKSAIVLLRSI